MEITTHFRHLIIILIMPASYFLMTIMQTNYKSKLFKDDLNVI